MKERRPTTTTTTTKIPFNECNRNEKRLKRTFDPRLINALVTAHISTIMNAQQINSKQQTNTDTIHVPPDS